MNESDLLGPRAYGDALGTAVLKATAEDFQVDEVLDIPLSGDGEHLWLWVEKRGLNTEEAARRIAKAAGVPLRTVSYAGLKDRQALTRQWFSVQLPGKADPDLSGGRKRHADHPQDVASQAQVAARCPRGQRLYTCA
jgi:tRNA pseudouridine13 synthase